MPQDTDALRAALAPRQIRDAEGLELTVMDLGATWLSCRVPIAGDRAREVLTRCEAGADRPGYLGSTVGRYANRIAGALLRREARCWHLLTAATERHQLHGGPEGFHARIWQLERLDSDRIDWSLLSQAGDQGFPGALSAQLSLHLPGGGVIDWVCEARVTEPCPVAITNHAYFNLDGHEGHALDQRLQIAAHRFAPVDAELIPVGSLQDTTGSDFDFNQLQTLSARWLRSRQQQIAGGYDHAFLLDARCADAQTPAAELESADGRLRLAIATSSPAIQLYTGQHLAGIRSATGSPLPACAGIALEPGFLPDSPNRPDWPQPSCWLEPGAVYRHRIRYRFSARSAGTGQPA